MTKSSPDLSILIVAYQSAEIISACIKSIEPASPKTSFEILLVDNGDGTTAELVASEFPEVTIVPSRGNIGFAAGNNLLAAQASGQFLLLINPDVILNPQAIDRLMEATKVYPSAAAWGGLTLDKTAKPDFGNTVHVPSLREMASRVVGRSSASKNRDVGLDRDARVAALSGSFVMFSRAAWDEVKGLDERYFLYCEEVDLFYRLAQLGHSFWRISSATALHDLGHGDAHNARRMLYRAAGNMQFVRLHWSKPRQILAFLLIWAGAWQRLLVGRLVGRMVPRLSNVADGYREIAMRPRDWRLGYDQGRLLGSKA